MLLSSEFDACTTKQMTKAEGCKCVDGISAKYIEIITVVIIFEYFEYWNLHSDHKVDKTHRCILVFQFFRVVTFPDKSWLPSS